MSLTKEKADEAIKQYIDQMKDICNHLLSFIDNSDSVADGDFQDLIKVIEKYGIQGNKKVFNDFISLLVNISNNHHRQSNFFDKIERIIINYKDTIKSSNTNIEIFELFSSSKRLLYFLTKSQILTIDDQITRLIEISSENNGVRFSDFFLFEIKKSDNDKSAEDEKIKYYMENFDEYEAKRKAGENDSYICSLIRQDSVEEFVKYISKSNISPSSQIKPSIFETNSLLNCKEPSLIEYAAFYGSIQIFQYLYKCNVKVNGSLWLYGIHSNNSDLLVNYIQNNHIVPIDKTYEEAFKECIKCHHSDIANYIRDNFVGENQKEANEDEENEREEEEHEYVYRVFDDGAFKITSDERIFDDTLKYHNYLFFPTNINQEYSFFYLCQYNYQYIVDLLIQLHKDEIEGKRIFFIKFIFK